LTNLIIKINKKKKIQHDTAIAFSLVFGDTNTMNPWSLIKAEKLETQNGIRYNLNVCQGSVLPALPGETLSSRPVPITALMPIELIQILSEGSK
jgi:hypothetical protein